MSSHTTLYLKEKCRSSRIYLSYTMLVVYYCDYSYIMQCFLHMQEENIKTCKLFPIPINQDLMIWKKLFAVHISFDILGLLITMHGQSKRIVFE